MQGGIDRANAEFWNELCGSTLARQLGVADHAPASLRRFDEAYFAYYPYLLPTVGPERWRGKKLLEVGLGFGSLSQRLAEAGADYHGLDLAANPVALVNERLARLGKPATAKVGSALKMPFADDSFDAVVSIGCLHHTGDLKQSLHEVRRVLRPGGTAVLMVYNAYSFREWTRRPLTTFVRWLAGPRRSGNDSLVGGARGEYDADCAGRAAPETVLTSAEQLRDLLDGFDVVRLDRRNCDPLSVRGVTLVCREKLLPVVGRWLGLDLYVEAAKRQARSAGQQASALKRAA